MTKMSIKMTKNKGKLSEEVHLDEEILKLALLYFSCDVLLGKEAKNLIDLHWVQLVDSLEDFNKYPWGIICYDRTLFGLKKALYKRIPKKVEKNDGKGIATYDAYTLMGFPYAFEIWAYKVIPLLGMKLTSLIGKSFPKILNWRGNATLKHTEIQSLFLEPNVSVIFFFFTFQLLFA